MTATLELMATDIVQTFSDFLDHDDARAMYEALGYTDCVVCNETICWAVLSSLSPTKNNGSLPDSHCSVRVVYHGDGHSQITWTGNGGVSDFSFELNKAYQERLLGTELGVRCKEPYLMLEFQMGEPSKDLDFYDLIYVGQGDDEGGFLFDMT